MSYAARFSGIANLSDIPLGGYVPGQLSGMKLQNGQDLPAKGTLMYIGTENITLYGDPELRTTYNDNGGEIYTIYTRSGPDYVGEFTGETRSFLGQLLAVQVIATHPRRGIRIWVWVRPNLTYGYKAPAPDPAPDNDTVKTGATGTIGTTGTTGTPGSTANTETSNTKYWILAAVALFFHITKK